MSEQISFVADDCLKQIEELEERLSRAHHEHTSREAHFLRVQEDYDRLHSEIGMLRRALKSIEWRVRDVERGVLPEQRAREIRELCNHPELAKRDIE